MVECAHNLHKDYSTPASESIILQEFFVAINPETDTIIILYIVLPPGLIQKLHFDHTFCILVRFSQYTSEQM
jgi:hypothetical protein